MGCPSLINGLFIRLEWKQMLRSRWMQLVAVLFVFVFAAISIIQQIALPDMNNFTRQTASFLNLLLFLLPLFILTIGSMGIANDLESGWFSLLKTYPMTIKNYIFGKYVALLLSFMLILLLAFSIVLGMSSLAGQVHLPLVFVGLSSVTILIFSALAIVCGVVAKSRLHALALSLLAWAFALLLLSYALMAVGTVVAGHTLQKLTIVMIHLNPAEWIRFGYFIFSGQHSVLGPSFYEFTEFYSSLAGLVVYVLVTICWIVLPLLFAGFLLRRKGDQV
ncbi:ABC transporter permease [Viridibacillus sp. FSL H8-0123]|uniref:ABC transporter permease n=1 Tax=Viridibacillus sp. FSL R5-0468 TaxID=2921640 RepID=UPI000688089D|nr:ABC transporter permease [Viridibacillus sp. FSL H7-0596]OMC85208.1 ABC transporter permease [Viridibacillus sp. FSL H8-0123]OMC92688.1 ABC transporter permease [Viridibacillus arenosi]